MTTSESMLKHRTTKALNILWFMHMELENVRPLRRRPPRWRPPFELLMRCNEKRLFKRRGAGKAIVALILEWKAMQLKLKRITDEKDTGRGNRLLDSKCPVQQPAGHGQTRAPNS